MGMSTRIVGFRPADEQWEKMKAAWEACEAIGVEPPEEIYDFFEGEGPGDRPGREVSLGDDAVTNIEGFARNGFQVDVEALPKGVRYIRFYNSW